jgi:hypothetical protein
VAIACSCPSCVRARCLRARGFTYVDGVWVPVN